MKPSALIGLVLRPVAACGDSHVSCRRSRPHGRRLGRTRPGDLSQPVPCRWSARPCKVWDPHPEKNLDFVWEPATGTDPGIAADGTINGKGRLVWRVRGSASYDPKTIYSVYSGEMRDGRPNGNGRLEIRSGEVFDGIWSNGALEGKGIHIDADGNRYEGMFAAGIAEWPWASARPHRRDLRRRVPRRPEARPRQDPAGRRHDLRIAVGPRQGDRRASGPTRSPMRRSAACSRRNRAAAMPARSRSALSSTSA